MFWGVHRHVCKAPPWCGTELRWESRGPARNFCLRLSPQLVYTMRESFYKNGCSNLLLRTCGSPKKAPKDTHVLIPGA